MPTCPKGHNSTATDYCDECGAPMSASSAAPATSAPAVSPPTPSAAAGSAAAGSAAAGSPAAGETCPECGTARDGRFCEVCGHDFLATPSPSPNGSVAAPATPAATPAPAADVQASRPAGVQAAAGTPEWRVVATADQAYYDRMQAAADADAEPVAFPAFCPQRRFALAGPQVLIGRHSRSRGIEPGIDLTGPPEDAGVSHSHALLVAGADGTWCVVDLDSANGTYLNDATDPLPPNQPTMLASGDQIHLGAWTTLTITTA